MPRFYHGAYIGTGAALTIDKVPFQPDYVRLFNATTGPTIADKTADMPGDDFFKTQAAVALVTAQGITLTADGFDLGTDADINTSGDTVYFVAFGN